MSTPPVQTINASDVGSIYHVGFGYSDPTADPNGNTGFKSYGYMLVNGTKYVKKTNVQAQGQLIQGSPNITDRDLVVYPRVNDGDFSGGGLQQIFVNPKKYYDSDLEVRTPGNLQLRPAWNRKTMQSSLGARGTRPPQAVTYGGTIYTTYDETNGNLYNQTGTITGPGFEVAYLDSDGFFLYASDGNDKLSRWNGTSWSVMSTTLSASIGGPHTQMWVINQGTAGRFVYFAVSPTALGGPPLPPSSGLSRWDITAQTGFQLPMGSNNFTIIDLCEYGGAVALMTNDVNNGPGMNAWYHDGNNLQLILRLDGYAGKGICNCLGNLFVTAVPTAQVDTPVLIQLGAGTFDIVASVGLPSNTSGAISIGAPTSSAQFVAFTVQSPTINGVSANSYVAVWDLLQQAYSHLGNLDTSDAPGITPRSLAWLGRAVFFPQILTTTGVMQYQSNQTAYTPNPNFASTGKMVSSRIDFNTPGIAKLFRRVVVHHTALKTGETLTVQAFVNLDPTAYTSSSTPTATVTNSTVDSTTTLLVLPQHTTGFSMVFVLKLVPGTSQATSPGIYYVSTEIAVPWVWEMTVDCTSKRKVLGNLDDPQGLRGLDLFFLLQNAWELAQPVTMYTAEGITYTVEVQDFQSESVSPQAGILTPTKPQDFESHVKLILSESVI